MDNNFKLVVVMPVYEDIEASSRLFNELFKIYDTDLYIVAIDDGSVNYPLDIKAIEDAGLNGTIIKLKCNVGHQRAISIGLSYVSQHMSNTQTVIVMDSDGEDTPESIIKLIAPLECHDIDIVVAKRKSRIETIYFKIFYFLYKFIFKLLSGKKISFGNFMALKPSAVRRLVNIQSLGLHFAGTVLSSKLRIKSLPLDRGPRYAGQSKMNFVGLVLHGFKGLMVFAEDVLVRVGMASAFIAFIVILAAFLAVLLKIFGFATPGWFSIALGILFLVFLQTGTITLMMLMLTGVVKNNSSDLLTYEKYIDFVVHTST